MDNSYLLCTYIKFYVNFIYQQGREDKRMSSNLITLESARKFGNLEELENIPSRIESLLALFRKQISELEKSRLEYPVLQSSNMNRKNIESNR